MRFESGQRVRLPHGPSGWVTVDFAHFGPDGRWTLYVAVDGETLYHKVSLTTEDAKHAEIAVPDGGAPSARALAGMWTIWLSSAAQVHDSPLRPYPHQTAAVYGAMLSQPRLRFLLADEPGTGKTVMAGLYLKEIRQFGKARRILIVAPAGLVSKWQADFDRFFGGGLRRITSSTVRENSLDAGHTTWIVSLELAAMNPTVLDAIHPERAGWDFVIFDEAHRLTPTAQSFHAVGKVLAAQTPSALLMTATPHRGSEWLFRHLLHLVDQKIYPSPGEDPKAQLPTIRPGSMHFLRRMKEDMVDHDGVTRLFKGRRATNHRVPLNGAELGVYERALALVDTFFPKQARPLARMVYGKRAASSLYALAETLRRRREHLEIGETLPPIPHAEEVSAREEAEALSAESVSQDAERAEIDDLLYVIDSLLATPDYTPSKWRTLVDSCLSANGILPGNHQQAVIFSEYSESARWITHRLSAEGYQARVYSGQQSHAERDEIRYAFMQGTFQVIVSTDAGNEGIDLQVAHVLVNYDIPWSLVRLEQRMGRIHRVGQKRDVELYNLVAVETREGDTLLTLLDNFANAAGELGGQIFDSLSVVAELSDVRYEEWLGALYGDDPAKKAEALAAVNRLSVAELHRQAKNVRAQENALKTRVRGTPVQTRRPTEALPPTVIQAYLRALRTAAMLDVRATAVSDEVLLLTPTIELSTRFAEGRRILIALEQSAFGALRSRSDGIEAVALTAGSPALQELVTAVGRQLTLDCFRGGPVVDPHATDHYDLVAFSASIDQAPWSVLIRVDSEGHPAAVGWELLTTLHATEEQGAPMPPSRTEAATREARSSLTAEAAHRENALHGQMAIARRELTALPVDVTMSVRDRDERIRLRERLSRQIEEKLARLETLCQVRIDAPRLLGWLHVLPGHKEPR